MKKVVIITILVLFLIYNIPPVLISSEGILLGKKILDKVLNPGLEMYDAESVFSHANDWEYFYFINTKPFDAAYVEELYIKDNNKGERVSTFLYKIKNLHSSDLEKTSSAYEFIRNGRGYYFYYGISV